MKCDGYIGEAVEQEDIPRNVMDTLERQWSRKTFHVM